MTAAEHIHSFHGQLAIKQSLEVRREEYLDYMTFRTNTRPLFTEIFGPLLGLKEEWAAQGATPAELDFSAFCYRRSQDGGLPVQTGWIGGDEEVVLEETAELLVYRDRRGRRVWNVAQDRGDRLFKQDSDGDMRPV